MDGGDIVADGRRGEDRMAIEDGGTGWKVAITVEKKPLKAMEGNGGKH